MASKAATDGAFRPMTLEEWRAYTGGRELGETLPYTDLGSPKPIDAAAKCPHGQYSAAYCVFCGDLHFDPHCKLTSETPVERKEIICERCGCKGKDKCTCRPERRYKFIGEDDAGENIEVRPNGATTAFPSQAQMLGPQFELGIWQYTDDELQRAEQYRIVLPVLWVSLLRVGLSKRRSACPEPKRCKYPLSHGHPTIENISGGKPKSGFGSFVDNPFVPRIRKPAITRNEIETRWRNAMRVPPSDPWFDPVYRVHRVRVNQRWVSHDLFPRRIEPPYLKEWAAEYWMRPTVTILRRPVPGEWRITWRTGSRPKVGKPMNWSKRSLIKVRVRLKVKDAAALWDVSERTARRRLAEAREKPYARVAVPIP